MKRTVITNTKEAVKRIVVAMSGGVDSSVAAHLLVEKYREEIAQGSVHVAGLFMRNWIAEDEIDVAKANTVPHGTTTTATVNNNSLTASMTSKSTCWENDANDARNVCDQLNIPLHYASFAAEYWTHVFEPFVEQMEFHNQTPNPDIGCNVHIKFGAMKEYARNKLQADMIATGHYSRLLNREDTIQMVIEHIENADSSEAVSWLIKWYNQLNTSQQQNVWKPLLASAQDVKKDQSYFLCCVPRDNLDGVDFPLGDMIKDGIVNGSSSVREIATTNKLSNASKRESMGICFIGKRKFTNFIQDYMHDVRKGSFVDVDTGEIVGQHDGVALYTIGQGARISGADHKYFVSNKDPVSATIFVCKGTSHPALFISQFEVDGATFNWNMFGLEYFSIIGKPLHALCRIRHLAPLIPCQVFSRQNNKNNNVTIVISLARPTRGVTPGQVAALYLSTGICVGGGIINELGPTLHHQHNNKISI